MDGNHSADAKWRRQASFALHVPIWPGWKGAEDADERSASTTQWREIQAENCREKKGGDEGLYGAGKDPACHVRPARPATHATGFSGRQSLLECNSRLWPGSDCIQRLCAARRPDDDLF